MLISAPILLDHFLEIFKRFHTSIMDRFTQNMHVLTLDGLTLDGDATPMVVDSVGDGGSTPMPGHRNWIPDQAGAAQAGAAQAGAAQAGAAQAGAAQAGAAQASTDQPVLLQIDFSQNRLYQRRMQRQ